MTVLVEVSKETQGDCAIRCPCGNESDSGTAVESDVGFVDNYKRWGYNPIVILSNEKHFL